MKPEAAFELQNCLVESDEADSLRKIISDLSHCTGALWQSDRVVDFILRRYEPGEDC